LAAASFSRRRYGDVKKCGVKGKKQHRAIEPPGLSAAFGPK
jgi:hypothetical protein